MSKANVENFSPLRKAALHILHINQLKKWGLCLFAEQNLTRIPVYTRLKIKNRQSRPARCAFSA